MGTLFPRKAETEISIQLEEMKVQASSAPLGLRNIGNTCYLNSTLQCLLQTQALSSVLSPALAGRGSHSQQRLIESYRAVVAEQSTARLRKLKRALNSKHRRYAGFKQMDSSEFFLDLMSSLMELSPELKEKVSELFTVEVTDVKKCAVCGNEITSKYEQLALTLPLAPAKVTFTVISGENGMSNQIIEGKENWTASDILKSIQDRTEIAEIVLILASSDSVLRIVRENDSLQSLNLMTNTLHFFAKEENMIIIELRGYKPSLFIKHSRGYVVLKWKNQLNAEELGRYLQEVTRKRFGDNGNNIVVHGEVAKVTCTAAYFQNLQQAQEFLSAFREPILRLELVSDGIQTPSRYPASDLKRDSSASLPLASCFTYISAEQPPDPSNLIPCTPCKSATSFSELSRLSHTSRYLVVCLQRYSAVSLEKDTREVEISDKLEIGEGYELYAVIKHKGSKSRGHYMSVVRAEGRWYLCNDSKVQELEAGEVHSALQQDAYILFYQLMKPLNG